MTGTDEWNEHGRRREAGRPSGVLDRIPSELRNRRGFRALAYLLSHPCEDISCLVLEREEIGDDAWPRLGGSRVAGHDARERACAMVIQRVAEAVLAVAQHSPSLHAHLSASLQLGMLCRYAPTHLQSVERRY